MEKPYKLVHSEEIEHGKIRSVFEYFIDGRRFEYVLICDEKLLDNKLFFETVIVRSIEEAIQRRIDKTIAMLSA